MQVGVTSHELRPYVALVEARKAKNPHSEAWSILLNRWEVVIDSASTALQQYSKGQPSNRITVVSAHHLSNVAKHSTPWEIIKTVLAMYILQDQQPNRFRSDEAFDFQLVRRVLRLAPTNAGSYWDNLENRTKKVYKDVAPRVIRALSAPLKEAFGAAGLTLAFKEREEAQRAADERQRLAHALGSLQ